MGHFLEDFSAPALAKAIEANQIGHLADLGRSPQVELHEGRALTCFVSDIPYPAFNRVLHARFEADDADAEIEATLGIFKSRKVPMTWHTGPSTRPLDMGRRLLAHGLAQLEDEPGMAIDLLSLDVDPPMPSALTIERVRDLKALRAWVYNFDRNFQLPGPAVEAILVIEASLGLREDLPRQLYVGWLKGEPVATSLLFLGAGVAGIYAVGTAPRARRQGIGRAMTLVPLLEARAKGCRIGTLHSSPMGLSLYRRLGFQEYCRLRHYVWAGEVKRRAP